MTNSLSHGSLDGPKQDTYSFAKQMANKYRFELASNRSKEELSVWLYNLEREIHE
jgi:hypothetical protein